VVTRAEGKGGTLEVGVSKEVVDGKEETLEVGVSKEAETGRVEWKEEAGEK
jgi:hypothetical protein